MKRWLANAMRRLADRIDHAGAPKCAGLTFTFEKGRGAVIHGELGVYDPSQPGCLLWYLNDDEREKAYTGTDRPGVWVDWETGTVRSLEELP
jgi:hypothetical protein